MTNEKIETIKQELNQELILGHITQGDYDNLIKECIQNNKEKIQVKEKSIGQKTISVFLSVLGGLGVFCVIYYFLLIFAFHLN